LTKLLSDAVQRLEKTLKAHVLSRADTLSKAATWMRVEAQYCEIKATLIEQNIHLYSDEQFEAVSEQIGIEIRRLKLQKEIGEAFAEQHAILAGEKLTFTQLAEAFSDDHEEWRVLCIGHIHVIDENIERMNDTQMHIANVMLDVTTFD
jgi:hypothetical protein